MGSDKKNDFENYLNHIRLIHFSFIILCATSSYLIFSNWTDNEKLSKEVNQFRHVVELISNQSLQSFGEESLNDYNQFLKKQLEKQLETKIDLGFIGNVDGDYVPDVKNGLSVKSTLGNSKDQLTKEREDSKRTLLYIKKIKKIDNKLDDVLSFLNIHRDSISSLNVSFKEIKWNDPDINITLQVSIKKNNQSYDSSFNKIFTGFIDTLIRFDDSWFKKMCIRDRSSSQRNSG